MIKFEAIILSGGKGTRVKKYTKKIPKCLIKINKLPFIHHQLNYLKKNDIKSVIISTGYKASKVDHYLKKNIDFIKYKTVRDGKKPLGSGGAIVKSLKYLRQNFFVIYGDSFLNFNLKELKKKNNYANLAIYKNMNKYDKSNIKLEKKGNIKYYKKDKPNQLHYIDYGVSYLNKKVFSKIRKNVKFDTSDLYESISHKNLLTGYKVKKRFYEIGSYNGIRDLENLLKNEIY